MSEMILMGKIVNVVGIKGEIKVYSYSDDGFIGLKRIYLNDKEYAVEKARMNGNTAVLKLKGINDRNTAETLVKNEIFMKEEDLKVLPEDQFYIRDLIGCEVVDNESGEHIGIITDVLQYTAQDNFEIKRDNGEKFFLPFVKAFVNEVIISEKKVKVSLIPGFIEGAIEA